MKVIDLLHAAAREIGLIAVGEELTADQKEDAFMRLNEVIDSFSLMPLLTQLRLCTYDTINDEVIVEGTQLSLIRYALADAICIPYGLDNSVVFAKKTELISLLKRDGIKTIRVEVDPVIQNMGVRRRIHGYY